MAYAVCRFIHQSIKFQDKDLPILRLFSVNKKVGSSFFHDFFVLRKSTEQVKTIQQLLR